MTVYYTENFDADCTPPALPAAWSTVLNSGTIATSTTQEHSSPNSLAVTPSSTAPAFFWETGLSDTFNGCTVADGWFMWTGTQSLYQSVNCTLRAQGVPTTNYAHGYLFVVNCGGNVTQPDNLNVYYCNGSGTNTSLYQVTLDNYYFLTTTWYRMICVIRDVANTGLDLGGAEVPAVSLSMYLQRGSDGAWLVTNNSSTAAAATWTATGVPVAAMAFTISATTNTYLGSGMCVWGAYTYTSSPGPTMYFDDLTYKDYVYPPSINSLPTWTPGNSVELAGTYVSVDSGSSALSNISDGNFDTGYASTQAWEAWAGLDLGSGNTAILTRVLLSPYTGSGYEHVASDLVIEGSTNETTWTSLGTSCSEADSRYNMIPLPVTAGSAYRYFRARTSEWNCFLSELRFEGQISAGTPSWKPVRPTITPGSGKFANGSTITLSTPTTGASIYYTLAVYSPFASVPLYGGNGAAPTTSSTLYTGPITLPSNQVTAVQAIAYDASATTVYSDVATGVFTCPQKYIPDTGVTRFSTGNNWCEDLWDDAGRLVNGSYPSLFIDSATGLNWMAVWDFNTTYAASTFGTRGNFLYSSTDLYNWHYVFRMPYFPAVWRDPSNYGLKNLGRLCFWMNPSPINGNNKYVCWSTVGATSISYAVCATAPAMIGPWTWKTFQVPYSGDTLVGDPCLFQDSNGTLWFVYDLTGGGNTIHAMQISSATDYTTFTGTPLVLDSTAEREALALFLYKGTYYLITSYFTGFGAGNSRTDYKAAAGASLSAVASALNAASWTTVWSSAPASTAVAYNAQGCQIIPASGRSGYLYSFCLCAPGDSSANSLYHMRPLVYPLPFSDLVPGASPSLSMAAPTTWTLAGSLPPLAGGAAALLAGF
ncbi:MAG TPA: chitobiase/beta-hexosaminidase C-terminal domain-containing protein [Isosphaeraceae bacterium]|nr:chitobiase/beta-hexosaminidase C-terminal domain-containing protein [Isosphaeraceae bacterium]